MQTKQNANKMHKQNPTNKQISTKQKEKYVIKVCIFQSENRK